MLNRIPGLKRYARSIKTQTAPTTVTSKAPIGMEQLLNMLGAPGILGLKISKDFMAMRSWWPLLIPLLIWEARRTYQRERERTQRLRQQRLFGKK